MTAPWPYTSSPAPEPTLSACLPPSTDSEVPGAGFFIHDGTCSDVEYVDVHEQAALLTLWRVVAAPYLAARWLMQRPAVAVVVISLAVTTTVLLLIANKNGPDRAPGNEAVRASE